MNVALRKRMSLAEFLVWEERQEFRYEFDGFQPLAMTGVTAAHSRIEGNLISALKARLRGSRCQAYGSSLKIEVAGSIRYPDVFVACTPVPNSATVVREPVVVFEVASRSTAAIDRTVKNFEHRDTPSMRRYVMLEQDRIAATVFARERGDWVGRLAADDAVLAMPEIGIELPLAEVYEGITFEQDGEPAAS